MNGFSDVPFNPSIIPDIDVEFIKDSEIAAFATALEAPESSKISSLNDWKPVHSRIRRQRRPKRSKDETREGFVYNILKWPLFLLVLTWIVSLGLSYFILRLYVWGYERYFTWRGKRQKLRQALRSTTNYDDWKKAAKNLDAHLGKEQWKSSDDYAYYDHMTITNVKEQLKLQRARALEQQQDNGPNAREAVEQLKSLVEASVKNNFFGLENAKLYSETYYGTKHLAQNFIDELCSSLNSVLRSPYLNRMEKYIFSQHLHTNYGRTALCLSGGASFAWYHFGVVKSLLDTSLLPDIITGTSGGALVAALVATHTNSELTRILVPALAHHMKACGESFLVWGPRWWSTGARFSTLEWARHCSWFCRGSTTFREAYERTGRILNVACVPSDPHSPTILANYLTAPDCVIWSAVLASAAVPGILNPVVLMMKKRDGTLSPHSFSHKWKDGSLRTDIPLKELKKFFSTNFSVVSQLNPHIAFFFYSSRGEIGRPSSHRKGRGWRGGYLGSAIELFLKLELSKSLKILRHLELLPRPLGQDWSGIWLQQFSGTITIWPKTRLSDYYYILSDPTPERLARMIRVGQQATFPKLLFLENRMKVERLIEEGLQSSGDGMETGVEVKWGNESLHLRGHKVGVRDGPGSMITYARSVGNGLMKRREMRLKGVRKIKVLIQATELMGIYGIMSWPKEPTKREWFSDA